MYALMPVKMVIMFMPMVKKDMFVLMHAKRKSKIGIKVCVTLFHKVCKLKYTEGLVIYSWTLFSNMTKN
jgi:hypothetical protein